jgi:EEF1A lysine methyltransferase 4
MKPMLERKDMWELAVKVLSDSHSAGGFEYFGFVMKRHKASNVS